MVWVPANFIAPVIKANAPHMIEPGVFSSSLRGYLREFFETTIRARAGDARLAKFAESAELVALYDLMPMESVFENLTAFNLSLELVDHERNPPETYGTQEAWKPLELTRQYVEVAADVETYAELVQAYSSSLDEVRACREVVEAVIAVSCRDARRAYLKDDEYQVLMSLAKNNPDSALKAYSGITAVVNRLDLDRRVSFNPFVA